MDLEIDIGREDSQALLFPHPPTYPKIHRQNAELISKGVFVISHISACYYHKWHAKMDAQVFVLVDSIIEKHSV